MESDGQPRAQEKQEEVVKGEGSPDSTFARLAFLDHGML